MELTIPEQRKFMRLDKLLHTFKTAAKDVGFNYSESKGENRELNNVTGSYQIPHFAIIHKHSWFGGKRIAVYRHYCSDEFVDREKCITLQYSSGIRLYTPHCTTEVVRPTCSSVLEIDDVDLRRFIAKFYDIL